MAFVMATLIALTGCRGKMERLREAVRFEGIEAVRIDRLPHVEIDFWAANGSAHNLAVKEAELDLRYRNKVVASLVLEQEVTLQRRSEGVITSRWRLHVRNPLAMISVAAELARGVEDHLAVDLRVVGRGGPIPINIFREKIPLSKFLNTFGMDPAFLTKIGENDE